uniref:Chloride channel CLIC-like protein 1 n=1 Tax=Leptobrachium leishanense TaxID=445787 RepID=A0A8C5QGI4_9ANUR
MKSCWPHRKAAGYDGRTHGLCIPAPAPRRSCLCADTWCQAVQVCTMKLVILISVVLIPLSWSIQDEEWIDPTDMLNYDAASGKMVKQPQASVKLTDDAPQTVQTEQTSCPAETKEYEKSLGRLKLQMEECKLKAQEKLSQSNSNPIFRRYLHKIVAEVERLGLPDDSQPEVHYDAEIFLTKHMLAEIQKFLNDGDWSIGALDEALSKTLVNFKPHNIEAWRWKFEDSFGVDLYTLFMILLCLLCIVSVIATEIWTHIRWYTQVKRLCILCIIISFGWNWLYLYKVAFAERQAELAKMHKYDSSCDQKITWTEGLFDWIKSSVSFRNDPCEEYFKALVINPVLMVPPTKALALTFTDFITEPLKHIGKGIGEFLHAMLKEIPIVLQIPVLIFLAIALLGFCYGTGTSIGHISRARSLPGPDPGQQQAIEHQRPNPPPSVQEVNYLHNLEWRLNQQQWRDRNPMPNQLEMRPEMREPFASGNITDDPTPKEMAFSQGTGSSAGHNSRVQQIPVQGRQKAVENQSPDPVQSIQDVNFRMDPERCLTKQKWSERNPMLDQIHTRPEMREPNDIGDAKAIPTPVDVRKKEQLLNKDEEHNFATDSTAAPTTPGQHVETMGDMSTYSNSEHGKEHKQQPANDLEEIGYTSKTPNNSVSPAMHTDTVSCRGTS